MIAVFIIFLLTLQNVVFCQKLADKNDIFNRTRRVTSSDLQTFSYNHPSLNRVIYRVIFDIPRKYPLVVSAVYDSLNNLRSKSNPKTTYFLIQNAYLTAQDITLQALNGDNYKTLKDIAQGHLFPWAHWMYSNWKDTQCTLNTYYNCAPQYSRFNSVPWTSVEKAVKTLILNEALNSVAYVVTGVSLAYSTIINNVEIPLYFWKLVCFRDLSGTPQIKATMEIMLQTVP